MLFWVGELFHSDFSRFVPILFSPMLEATQCYSNTYKEEDRIKKCHQVIDTQEDFSNAAIPK